MQEYKKWRVTYKSQDVRVMTGMYQFENQCRKIGAEWLVEQHPVKISLNEFYAINAANDREESPSKVYRLWINNRNILWAIPLYEDGMNREYLFAYEQRGLWNIRDIVNARSDGPQDTAKDPSIADTDEPLNLKWNLYNYPMQPTRLRYDNQPCEIIFEKIPGETLEGCCTVL